MQGSNMTVEPIVWEPMIKIQSKTSAFVMQGSKNTVQLMVLWSNGLKRQWNHCFFDPLFQQHSKPTGVSFPNNIYTIKTMACALPPDQSCPNIIKSIAFLIQGSKNTVKHVVSAATVGGQQSELEPEPETEPEPEPASQPVACSPPQKLPIQACVHILQSVTTWVPLFLFGVYAGIMVWRNVIRPASIFPEKNHSCFSASVT